MVPATVEPVGLWGRTGDGTLVTGQYAVSQTPGIVRVDLDPPGTKAPDGLVDAVHAADQIVLGPGSVYTSVLAATLVEDIGAALDRSTARCVYVCNLVPEQAETLGYDVAAHVGALRRHGVRPDVVLVQAGGPLALGDTADLAGTEVVTADVASSQEGVHDAAKLAAALTALASGTHPDRK